MIVLLAKDNLIVNYEVIDNFLPTEDFIKIKEQILGDYFPWYLNDYITNKDEKKNYGEKYYFQFTHCFLKDELVNSDWMKILFPLLNKINPKKIFRIKSNLQANTDNPITYDFHVDSSVCNTTAIYYINTNNGKTI